MCLVCWAPLWNEGTFPHEEYVPRSLRVLREAWAPGNIFRSPRDLPTPLRHGPAPHLQCSGPPPPFPPYNVPRANGNLFSARAAVPLPRQSYLLVSGFRFPPEGGRPLYIVCANGAEPEPSGTQRLPVSKTGFQGEESTMTVIWIRLRSRLGVVIPTTTKGDLGRRFGHLSQD